MKRENDFQASLIDELKETFSGCIVLKNDSSYMQGIPDLSIFYRDKWAMLECKKNANASHQANQDYYVTAAMDMSYAAFIYPENKDEVMEELKRHFA